MSRSGTERTRRTVLLASAVLVGFAGCSGSDDGAGGSTDETDSGDTTDAADGDTDQAATDAEDDGLDLGEANVVGVEFERQGSQYTFDVSLHHDDGGEEGYANWWQVERLDGSRVGRRELTHPHSTQPFTRSDSFEIADARCVVVRGHDQTHGYGGRTLLVDLEANATRTVDQGTDPQSFSDSDCP